MTSFSDPRRDPAATAERDTGTHGGATRRLWQDRRGAVIVEFAILAPVLLLIMVGTLVFGLAVNQYVTLWNAAGASALQFAISAGVNNGVGGVPTPATNAWNALIGAAPTLTQGTSCGKGLCLTLYVNTTACLTDATSVTAAGSADAECNSAMTTNATATAVATYPCTLQVLQFNFRPNCKITAQATQGVP